MTKTKNVHNKFYYSDYSDYPDYIGIGSFHFSHPQIKKALSLLSQGVSYRKLNRVLKNRFGSALSFSTLKSLKARLLLQPGIGGKIYEVDKLPIKQWCK